MAAVAGGRRRGATLAAAPRALAAAAGPLLPLPLACCRHPCPQLCREPSRQLCRQRTLFLLHWQAMQRTGRKRTGGRASASPYLRTAEQIGESTDEEGGVFPCQMSGCTLVATNWRTFRNHTQGHIKKSVAPLACPWRGWYGTSRPPKTFARTVVSLSPSRDVGVVADAVHRAMSWSTRSRRWSPTSRSTCGSSFGSVSGGPFPRPRSVGARCRC